MPLADRPELERPESAVLALAASLPAFDEAAARAARERQDRLTKPTGALGDLERLADRLAGVFGTPLPDPRGAAVIVCAADHGVAAEDVSAYPAEVTAAMIATLASGRAAIGAIANSVGANVVVVDVGVAARLPAFTNVRDEKVRLGTRNLALEPAMTRSEAARALLAGARVAGEVIAAGADLVVPGEIGIGNTTAAAAITARMLKLGPNEVTGRGTGVNDARLARKVAVVERALARAESDPADPLGVLADLGGLEIAAMLGVMLRAAAARRAVVLDGFVEGAAALVGVALAPGLRDFLFAAGRCAEVGHGAQLAALKLKPMFDLDLRLGEGTGGALAVPLLRAATAALRDMSTFEEAGVPTG